MQESQDVQLASEKGDSLGGLNLLNFEVYDNTG